MGDLPMVFDGCIAISLASVNANRELVIFIIFQCDVCCQRRKFREYTYMKHQLHHYYLEGPILTNKVGSEGGVVFKA